MASQKTNPVTGYFTDKEKEVIKTAAELDSRSVANFIHSVIIREAIRIIDAKADETRVEDIVLQ